MCVSPQLLRILILLPLFTVPLQALGKPDRYVTFSFSAEAIGGSQHTQCLAALDAKESLAVPCQIRVLQRFGLLSGQRFGQSVRLTGRSDLPAIPRIIPQDQPSVPHWLKDASAPDAWGLVGWQQEFVLQGFCSVPVSVCPAVPVLQGVPVAAGHLGFSTALTQQGGRKRLVPAGAGCCSGLRGFCLWR